jgi:cytochrome c oxidase assembly factor CtaG
VDPYAWEWHAHAFVAVPVAVLAYAAAARSARPSGARVAAFVAGLVLVVAVLVTPVERLALHYLLSLHLLQNVVLAEWAPGLLALGVAPAVGRRVRVPPLVVLPLWLATYFAWHVPAAYDFALRHQDSVLHLEHLSYVLTGLLMWWPVVHGRLPTGAKALYTFAAFVLASPLGLLLALLPRAVYGFYVDAPRLWGLSPLADQQLGGATMAGEQAVVFFVVFAVLFLRFLGEEQAAGLTALPLQRSATTSNEPARGASAQNSPS